VTTPQPPENPENPESPDSPETSQTPAAAETLGTPEAPAVDDGPSPDEAGWAAPEPPSAAWAPPPAATPPVPPAPVAAGAAAPSAAWTAPGTVGSTPVTARQNVNGMAVASLVLGLCCWCFFVPGILAVVFGNLALGRIAVSDGREKGRGMAIAGIVLGWISIAVLAGLAIAWLVYGIGNA
jgi:hypothetical protein